MNMRFGVDHTLSHPASQYYDYRPGMPWALQKVKGELENGGCYKGGTVVVSCALRSRDDSGARLAMLAAS